jgi:hypothetical protein
MMSCADPAAPARLACLSFADEWLAAEHPSPEVGRGERVWPMRAKAAVYALLPVRWIDRDVPK